MKNKIINFKKQIGEMSSFGKFIKEVESFFSNNPLIYFKIYVKNHYAYNYDCMVIYIDDDVIEKPLWDHYRPDIIPRKSLFNQINKELEHVKQTKYIYFANNINHEY